MSFNSALKRACISCHVYGPIKRLHRSLLDREDLRRFRKNVALYAPFISRGDLCFDVGSNVGQKSEAFLKLGARVVAFEPQPSCLRETAARCGPTRRLTTVNAALGAMPGELPMYVAKQSQCTSLVANWAPDVAEVIQVTQVPVITLDQAIERYGLPRFCKIDVEGYELEVLRGLNRPIPILTLEYHLHAEKMTFDCVDYLSQFGDLSINITQGEDPGFRWPKWISHDAFRSYFPSRVPRTATCGFGDLFIRIT
jgi:FkbM family methyltransferase